jgi:hypothetical protein
MSDIKMIPKIIHQTYHSKDKIPSKVYDGIKLFASNYEHRIYDNKDCIHFIATHFHKRYVQAFKRLRLGAHKADLFRYCILYICGGIYLDIKTQLIQKMPEFQDGFHVCIGLDKKSIYNGIMVSPPKNPLFLTLLEHCAQNVFRLYRNYGLLCDYFYECVKKDLGVNKLTLRDNHNYCSSTQFPYNYYIYHEIEKRDHILCRYLGLDRYGFCTFIVNPITSEILFKVRYHDFPW